MKNMTNLQKITTIFDKVFYVAIALATFQFIIDSSAFVALRDSMVISFLRLILINYVPFLAVLRILLIWMRFLMEKKQNNQEAAVETAMSDSSQYACAILVLDTVILFLIFFYWFFHGRYSSGHHEYLALLCTVGFLGLSFQKAVKIWFNVEIICIVFLFISSFFGLITNFHGNSWGYVYHTDYACILLFVCLAYYFYHRGKISLTGGIFLLMIFFYNLFWVGGKIAFICMLFGLIITGVLNSNLLSHITQQLKQISEKFLYVISIGSFWILSLIMIFCSAFFSYLPENLLNRIPKFGTIVARMWLSEIGFKIFDLHLFGNNIAQWGNGGSESGVDFYYFLDSSYIRLLLQNGVLLFILILGLMTFVQWRLYQRKKIYCMLIISLVALDCFVEHHIADLAYNIFLLLPFADIDGKEENSSILPSAVSVFLRKKEKQIVLFWKRNAACKRIAISAALVLALIFNAVLASGKAITRWNGDAPAYNTTVIVPIDQLTGKCSANLVSNQEKSTFYYLASHKDTDCIISFSEQNAFAAEACRKYCEERGIEPARIYMDSEAENMREVLQNAQKIIDDNNLPSRKAVCAPAIMQVEIDWQAEKLGTTVNGLRARMPAEMYFPIFIRQQLLYIRMQAEKLIRYGKELAK